MRRVAAGAIGLLALVFVYQVCVVPWQSNKISKTMEATIRQALAGDPRAIGLLQDGRTLAVAEAWRARTRDDANLNVSVAAALALVGRTEDALRVYDEALRYDRRPEIYFNRAGLRLRLNDTPGALDDFVYAIRFNPTLLDDIRTDAIRLHVESELARIRSGAK